MSIQQNDANLAEQLKPVVMTLRIIVFSLAGGVLFFAGTAIFLRSTGAMADAGQPSSLMTFMAVGFALAALVASRVIPAVIARNARGQIAGGEPASFPQAQLPASLGEMGDAGTLYGVYQTKTIVGAALLEGAAFFCVVAYLIEGGAIALGLGIGLAVAVLSFFPSTSRVAAWIERQLRLMGEERTLAR